MTHLVYRWAHSAHLRNVIENLYGACVSSSAGIYPSQPQVFLNVQSSKISSLSTLLYSQQLRQHQDIIETQTIHTSHIQQQSCFTLALLFSCCRPASPWPCHKIIAANVTIPGTPHRSPSAVLGCTATRNAARPMFLASLTSTAAIVRKRLFSCPYPATELTVKTNSGRDPSEPR